MTDSTNSMSCGWLFIVLLLFFGIFGGWNRCGGGFFGGNGGWGGCGCGSAAFAGAELGSLTDLIALKGHNCSNTANGINQVERDVLDLKYTTGQQSAVLEQQLETAFRTIISNQDKGFADLRIQQLQDTINDRNMTLMAQNAEINALKGQIYADGRFNALERQIEGGFCQTIKRPPFYPYGCTPCNAMPASCGCGVTSTMVG